MKILQLIQAKQYRGAEIFCCQLSNHLSNLGHEVMIVSVYEGKAVLPFKKRIHCMNRPRKKRFFDHKGWLELALIIKKFKPEIIQANAADTLKYAVFSKFFFGWKEPIIYRNASASSFYIKNRFTKNINAFLLKKVNGIISVSKASKNDLNCLFPFTLNKTSVIPIGIEKKTSLRNLEDTFDKNYFNILHVGSFSREKNHYEVLKIYEKFKTKDFPSKLHLIGDGELRNEIVELTQKMGLIGSVVFHGGLKDPIPYIKNADVLILPSVVEGLPAVILEAMYYKTPVIAYNVGGVSEVVSQETGSLVEVHNLNDFLTALHNIRLASGNEKIQKGYKLVNENFGNLEIAKRFLEFYYKILSQQN